MPAALVAVMVKFEDEIVAVGVPEIAPVEELIVNPAGKLGLIVQEVTGLPKLVGVIVGIAAPLTTESELGS